MRSNLWLVLTLGSILFMGISCVTPSLKPQSPPEGVTGASPSAPGSYFLPTEEGKFRPPVLHVGRKPVALGTVFIESSGEFTFEAMEVSTARPDIFQPGHFSLFDILTHLAERGDISLEYHFDETMQTHVIDAINDEGTWWYFAYYSGGWRERNVFRMDTYPYKDGTIFHLFQEDEGRLERMYQSFQQEVARLEQNDGEVIIPEVTISGPGIEDSTLHFQEVAVTAHNVRRDVLQPGVITALDILLSLAEQGELSQLKLTWYESIGSADPVDSYWTEQIDGIEASERCGFVYEVGPLDFSGFDGSHIHIPSDVRVIISPEYALWFWICL